MSKLSPLAATAAFPGLSYLLETGTSLHRPSWLFNRPFSHFLALIFCELTMADSAEYCEDANSNFPVTMPGADFRTDRDGELRMLILSVEAGPILGSPKSQGTRR